MFQMSCIEFKGSAPFQSSQPANVSAAGADGPFSVSIEAKYKISQLAFYQKTGRFATDTYSNIRNIFCLEITLDIEPIFPYFPQYFVSISGKEEKKEKRARFTANE